MAANYFVNQYAPMNNIDPHSDESIRRWLNNCAHYYEFEIGRYMPAQKDAAILDLGCGIGGTIHYLNLNGFKNVTGIDKSEDQLAVCRKFVSKKVILADAVDYLKASTGNYGCIIALDLIEHLSKLLIPEFCNALFEALIPGGSIILKTPNMASLFAARSRYLDFTHEVGFTEESIRQILVTAGFQHIAAYNSFVGRKRIMLVSMFQRIAEKIYGVSPARVVTPNLIVIAKKL